MVAMYGCELWGLLTIPDICTSGFNINKLYSMQHVMEQQRCRILKSWLQLPRSTPSLCLLHELGCEPLVHEYVRRAVRWWNTLTAQPRSGNRSNGQQPWDGMASSPYEDVLRQNAVDGIDKRYRNFTGALFSVLRLVLGESGLAYRMRSLAAIDMELVEAGLKKCYNKHISKLASVVVGEGSIKAYYFGKVAKHELGVRPCWYGFKVSNGILKRVLRFRLGQHHLRVNTDRWVVPKPARAGRTCRRCELAQVDDECHCLFRCGDAVVRSARSNLFFDIRREWGSVPLNSIADIFQVVEQAESGDTRYKCVRFVALCHRAAERGYRGLEEWQQSWEYLMAAENELGLDSVPDSASDTESNPQSNSLAIDAFSSESD